MAANAFTYGVKPGGLTTDTEIKILLCYIVKSVTVPLTQKDIADALVNAELVNYFELLDALNELVNAHHLNFDNQKYTLTPTGRSFAELLITDVPASVREQALNAVIKAQQFNAKAKQHHTEILPVQNGYLLKCRIDELGSTMFEISVYLPDLATAQQAEKAFIENGADIFKLVLAGLSGDKLLAAEILQNKAL